MLLEKLNKSYSYSSLQINLPFDFSQIVFDWCDKHIEKQTIFNNEDNEYGIEDECHITVLYGIDEEYPYITKSILQNFKPFNIELGYISKFYSDEYDVLKIDVKSETLENLHYSLEDGLSNDNSYPEYLPHLTLSYVLKNTNDQFVGLYPFKKKFLVNSLCFCYANKSKHTLRLK